MIPSDQEAEEACPLIKCVRVVSYGVLASFLTIAIEEIRSVDRPVSKPRLDQTMNTAH